MGKNLEEFGFLIFQKLYKKYKIKVVSVTPSELGYMDDVMEEVVKLSKK